MAVLSALRAAVAGRGSANRSGECGCTALPLPPGLGLPPGQGPRAPPSFSWMGCRPVGRSLARWGCWLVQSTPHSRCPPLPVWAPPGRGRCLAVEASMAEPPWATSAAPSPPVGPCGADDAGWQLGGWPGDPVTGSAGSSGGALQRSLQGILLGFTTGLCCEVSSELS